MARFTETEQDQMARARIDLFEQIARREQATDVDIEGIAQRSHLARAAALRTLAARLKAGLTRTFPGLARARVRARVRRELSELSPEMLRDLGITPTEIRRVAREQAEAAVPRDRGAQAVDAPTFKARPHGAYDVARYA